MQCRPFVQSAVAILAVLAAQPGASAQTSPFTVTSAASYQTTVAPDSLVSMFGANLAAAAASATLDANGQLPTQLGGISVLVDGQAAALLYVSPLQVNFLVPGSTTPGNVSVVVQRGSGTPLSGTMQVQNTALGIFTADSSGSGAGSILNAVTYAGAPFLVETTANTGSDKRTRLSVYATGVRYAGNPNHDPTVTNVAGAVDAEAQDTSGNHYSLTVEYAGAAPGYFGLDQVNLVLPPELDSAGVVSLTLAAELSTSNVVTFQMGSLPASEIGLAGITLDSTAVTGGDGLTGTVSLNAPARTAGFVVALRSSNGAVQLPLSLTIPVGQVSANFSIATSSVTTVQMVTISAQSGGTTQNATLEVDPLSTVRLTNFLIAPSSVQGGQTASGTVSLGAAALSGGASVQITSSSSAAQPPAAVTVPFGATSATFSIPTSVVTAPQTATLTATYGKVSLTAPLAVMPVLQLTLQSNTITGGNSVNGTITLGQTAPAAGVTLNVQCDNRAIAQPPLTVTIPGGQTSVSFVVTTIPVTASRTITITVSYGGSTQSATLTVNPAGTASLSSLMISPDHVTGGTNATGTATLGAPAPIGGTAVNLMSSNVFAAQVPQFIQVPQGQTSATFTITTTHSSATQTVTITGSTAGVSKSATLTVQ
ncbi:MAG TPA: hypothetical protein VKU19_37750 [Bryobacteraceae bacterium]|nr:hypothetical protein [Bryobacteraceae bacterium]